LWKVEYQVRQLSTSCGKVENSGNYKKQSMNENDKIALYEILENFGYDRKLLKEAPNPQRVGYSYTLEAFDRVLFYVVTDGLNWRFNATSLGEHQVLHFTDANLECYELSADNELKEIPLKRFHEFRPKISEIHDRIFNLLSDKHQADDKFLFRMRSRNNKGRYEKGFWFLGNDDFLVLSFWAGQDWKNKTPNIWLGLNVFTGRLWVQYVGSTDNATATFLDNLANVNSLEQLKRKGSEVNLWERTIFKDWQGDYIKAIEKFIQTEKVIIDTFLKAAKNEKQDLGDFDFLDRKEFNKLYKRMNTLRAAQTLAIENRPKVIDYKEEIIRLDKIVLSNIGHFVHLELDLSPRVICIFGQNGIGKTTVLRALLLALTGVDETDAIDMDNANLQRLMKIKGTTEKGEIEYERSGTITLNYQHGEAVQNVIEFNPRKNDTVEIRDEAGADDTMSSFTATYDNGLYTQLIIGFAQVHGRKPVEAGEKTEKKANVQDILSLIYDVEDNRFENLSGWIMALYADRTATDELILSLIFEVVSEITATEINFKTVNAKDHLIWVTLAAEAEAPQEIMFSLLSQGYKNVFAWVGHFVKRLAEANDYAGNFKERPAIVVIDEIDTYLHPLWQRNILNVLAKTFINTQFIVTTHSPLVANYLEEQNKAVYIIQNKGAVEKVQHIQGVNLKDAFYSWMGIPYRDAATQQRITELFLLIDEDLDKAKQVYKELEKQLGENDGDLYEAKTEIELSEDFDDLDFDNE
jgi:predicted ATP-binding protein involved in virulence